MPKGNRLNRPKGMILKSQIKALFINLDLITEGVTKLQDIINLQPFPILRNILKKDHKAMALIDKLNRLGRLNNINPKDWWRLLPEKRHQVSAEHPDNPHLTSQSLNTVSQKLKDLTIFWQFLRPKILTLTY
ncbi:MAG: hypothetical protein K0M45_11005 [Candidatus Paracaedibacteraceae bacterium]|nr:hypothetical protein [Candidatus Paracaedibacteraceae bacterium]